MTTQDLNFTQFVDLMLARIAEVDREHPGTWVEMFPLAEELQQNVPENWVFDARDVLESRGLVKPLKVLGRTAPARLSAQGRLYVERGGDTGIIAEYQQHRSNFVIVSGTGHQVVVGVDGDVSQTSVGSGIPSEAWTLLEHIERSLRNDDSIGAREREDALSDVGTARAQLERPEPNAHAAIALLDPLTKLSAIGESVAKLIALLS
jgi:hypothetical protein